MTIVLVVIELLHADRQEEKHGKENMRFSNFHPASYLMGIRDSSRG
jgi:hypothetical protein